MDLTCSLHGNVSSRFKFPGALYFHAAQPKIQPSQNPARPSTFIDPGMNDCDEPDDEVTSLSARLAALRTEHRDLDAVIGQLISAPINDELLLRRLKKRKLLLKDRIAIFERILDPDVPA